MKSYLEYLNTGFVIDIKSDEKNISFNSIEITEEQKEEVIDGLKNKKVIKVINDEIVYLEDLNIKKSKILTERDDLLKQLDPYHKEKYQAKLGLTADDVADIDEYWERLLDMPQAFDDSTDKEAWQYVFVEEYTSGKNGNKYQLKKPHFVK